MNLDEIRALEKLEETVWSLVAEKKRHVAVMLLWDIYQNDNRTGDDDYYTYYQHIPKEEIEALYEKIRPRREHFGYAPDTR